MATADSPGRRTAFERAILPLLSGVLAGKATEFYASVNNGLGLAASPQAVVVFSRLSTWRAALFTGRVRWLIFDLPEADMGCHPADPGAGAPSGRHDISFCCDDIEQTVAELKAKGVEFTAPVADRGYGLVTHFKVPGGFAVQLYQPRYSKRASPQG